MVLVLFIHQWRICRLPPCRLEDNIPFHRSRHFVIESINHAILLLVDWLSREKRHAVWALCQRASSSCSHSLILLVPRDSHSIAEMKRNATSFFFQSSTQCSRLEDFMTRSLIGESVTCANLPWATWMMVDFSAKFFSIYERRKRVSLNGVLLHQSMQESVASTPDM